MSFKDILEDIERMLVDRELQGIKKGVEITITKVDRKNKKIELITVDRKSGRRDFDEIERLWVALCRKPAIHVETVFGGSGTSRNQPETILANLPYIEWLRVANKKNIAYVGGATHAPGTLKKMEPLQVEKILLRLGGEANMQPPNTMIVTDDMGQVADDFENSTGIPVTHLELGVDMYEHSGGKVILVTRSVLPPTVESGTYLVIEGWAAAIPSGSISFKVADRQFYVLKGSGINLIVAV